MINEKYRARNKLGQGTRQGKGQNIAGQRAQGRALKEGQYGAKGTPDFYISF